MSGSKKNDIIASAIPAMFRGVRPGWKRILFSEKIKPILNECLHEMDKYLRQKGVSSYAIEKNGLKTYIRPAETQLFESMKYFDPQNLKVIIMGQDPYPKQGEAHGLSFSVPKKAGIPRSLKVIYDCLTSQNIINSYPNHGNLVNWARQGVLLLNRFLTRSPNIISEKDGVWIDGNGDSDKSLLHTFWGKFTSALLSYLTDDFMKFELNHHNHKLHILLWGEHAQKASIYVNKDELPIGREVIIYEWGHPSPASQLNQTDNPRNFKYCDHFIKINEINWDPDFIMDDASILLDQFYTGKKEGSIINEEFLITLYDQKSSFVYDDATTTIENSIVKEFLEKKKCLKEPESSKLVESTEPEKPEKPAEPDNPEKISENQIPIVAAIDGGCKGNGDESARAGYGVYFPKIFNGLPNPDVISDHKLCGWVPLFLMKIDENKNLVYLSSQTKRTNGRGELLAAIYAIKKVIEVITEIGPRPVILVADADYVLNLINERIWKYLAKDSKLSSVKTNKDLVVILCKLLLALAKLVPNAKNPEFKGKKSWDILLQPNAHDNYKNPKRMDLSWGGLTMLHTPSHMKEKKIPIPKKNTVEYDMYKINDAADKLCEMAITDISEEDQDPLEFI
jgi:uracil-DNA glycosylase